MAKYSPLTINNYRWMVNLVHHTMIQPLHLSEFAMKTNILSETTENVDVKNLRSFFLPPKHVYTHLFIYHSYLVLICTLTLYRTCSPWVVENAPCIGDSYCAIWWPSDAADRWMRVDRPQLFSERRPRPYLYEQIFQRFKVKNGGWNIEKEFHNLKILLKPV